MVRGWRVLYVLTWKCASRHNGVQFFDVSISKSGPNMVCFVHFDLEMCFAPQRCTCFRHLYFQKWSEHEALLAFLLTNVLRATTACNFSSLIWPAGSAPAALARLLFDPPEPQIIGKTQWIVTFLPFAHLHLLSSDLLPLWSSPSLIFSSLTLPTSALPSLHIVGSLTSKPSTIKFYLSRWLRLWTLSRYSWIVLVPWDPKSMSSFFVSLHVSPVKPFWKNMPMIAIIASLPFASSAANFFCFTCRIPSPTLTETHDLETNANASRQNY